MLLAEGYTWSIHRWAPVTNDCLLQSAAEARAAAARPSAAAKLQETERARQTEQLHRLVDRFESLLELKALAGDGGALPNGRHSANRRFHVPGVFLNLFCILKDDTHSNIFFAARYSTLIFLLCPRL